METHDPNDFGEPILPASLHAMRAGGRPSLRLRLAVLEGAVRDFQRFVTASDEDGQRRFRHVSEWFAGASRADPYAFESVCAVLDVEPSVVRANLARWQAMQFVHEARQWLAHRATVPAYDGPNRDGASG